MGGGCPDGLGAVDPNPVATLYTQTQKVPGNLVGFHLQFSEPNITALGAG